jgi:hypothetical protein
MEVRKIAPKIGPKMDPMPPMMTINNISKDWKIVKEAGDM